MLVILEEEIICIQGSLDIPLPSLVLDHCWLMFCTRHQGMGPLINIIEEATRLPPRHCLHSELVELGPELRGQHGLVVRERTHRGWGAGG